MSTIAFELGVILLLLIANGVFSMSEIAVVSARKARLRQRVESGDARAQSALELAENPNRFLATVQVGITLVGTLAAAFGGVSISGKLAGVLGQVTWLEPYAQGVSFVLFVACLTVATLVIGELVPKRLGLSNPEGIAGAIAGPMRALSRLAAPLVTMLGWCTDAVLRVFRLRTEPEVTISDEEIKFLVREGTRAGVFHPSEPAMVEGVLALDRLTVRDLMTPRVKIIWVNVQEPHETIWHKIVVSGHTTFPVFEGNRDRVVGMGGQGAADAECAGSGKAAGAFLNGPPARAFVVGQAFQPDGLPDFRVRQIAAAGRLESRPDRQTGMSALRSSRRLE